MKNLVKKLTSIILIILITFSISYNMLSCGYKVLAEGTLDTVEIISTNGVFKMILPDSAVSPNITETSMPVSEWQALINKYETYYYNAKVIMNGTDNKQVTIEYVDSELVSEHVVLRTNVISKRILYGNRALSAFIQTKDTTYAAFVHEIDHLFQSDSGSSEFKHVIVYTVLYNQIMGECSDGLVIRNDIKTYLEKKFEAYDTADHKYGCEASLIINSLNSTGAMQAIINFYANNQRTPDTFYEAMKTYAGIDLDTIILSNGQTVYQFIGGTNSHQETYTFSLIQGNTYLIQNNKLTNNKLDWLSSETIAYEATNLEGATITLTGHVQDNGTFRKIEGQEPNIDNDGNEVAYLKIVKDGKELLNLAILVENERLEGEFYYKIGVEDAMPIPEDKKIEVEVGEVIQISYINEDVTEKMIEVANSFFDGDYINGNTIFKSFRFKQTGTIELKFDGEVIAEFIVKEKEDKTQKIETKDNVIEIEDTLYLYNYQTQGKDKVTLEQGETEANTDRPNTSVKMGGEFGGTDNWIIKGDDINYYCFDHGDSIQFEGGAYFYRYRLESEIEIETKHKLILAYIKNVPTAEAAKISGISLQGEDWREHLIQYYIWSEIQEGNKSGISYGSLDAFIRKITTFTNGKNEYIDIQNQTITYEGKTHKLKTFAAFKYIVNAKFYSSTGNAKWANKDDEGMQPLFTFICEITQENNIPYIQKIDAETLEMLGEAVFEIYHYDETRKYDNNEIEYKEEVIDEVATTEFEKTALETIPLTEKEQYLIIEKTAPEGYQITREYGILTVDPQADAKVTLKVKRATSTGQNGEAIPYAQDPEIQASAIWKLNKIEEEGNSSYVITVENQKEKQEPTIYFGNFGVEVIKYAEDGTTRLNGATFTLYEDEACTKTVGSLLAEKGNTLLVDVNKAGTINYYLKETIVPSGYKVPEYLIKLTVTATSQIQVINEQETTKINVTKVEGEAIGKANDKAKYFESEKNQIKYGILEITNEIEQVNEVEIQINKINGSNGEALPGVIFSISPGNVGPKTLQTQADGKTPATNLKDIINGKLELEKTYTLIITETTVPQGFTKLENPITLTITTHQDGKITYDIINTNSVGVSAKGVTENGVLKITISITNYPEQAQNLEVPLLMNIEGTVFLDMPSGKQDNITDGLYEEETDKLLSGILVEIYEENGTTPAELVSANDLKKAIDNITELQNSAQNTFNQTNNKTVVPGLNQVFYKKEDTETLKEAGANLLKTYLEQVAERNKEKYATEIFLGQTINYAFSKELTEILDSYCNLFNIEIVQTDIVNTPTVEYGYNSKATGRLLVPTNYSFNESITSYNMTNREYIAYSVDEITSIFNTNALSTLRTCYDITSDGNLDTNYNSIYEEVVSQETMAKLNEHLSGLQTYGNNKMVTKEDGKFYFYGLNPNKSYKLRFYYNGILYKDVKYNVQAGATFTSKNIALNNSVAVEDEEVRAKVTRTFSEIGSYPYNYNSPSRGIENRVFLPEELMKLTNEEILKAYIGNPENELEFFLKDSMVTATTVNSLGNILKSAEEEVIKLNKQSDSEGNITNEVYPVVVKVAGDTANTYNEAVLKARQQVSEQGNGIIGYYVYEEETYKKEWVYSLPHDAVGSHPGYQKGSGTINRISKTAFNYKQNQNTSEYTFGYIPDIHGCSGHTEEWIDEDGKPQYTSCGAPITIVGMIWELQGTNAKTELFKITEGYSTSLKTIEGGTSPILFANFLMNAEPYFSSNNKAKGYYDNYISNNGRILPSQGEFYNIGGVELTTTYGWGKNPERTKAQICYDLVNGIDVQERLNALTGTNTKFGIEYRKTMDLGLINDILNAEVTINGKTVNYVYNKRAANGETFKFGVNEYDINGQNTGEEKYSEFKQYLANKNLPENYNRNEITEEEEERNIRKYDVDTPKVAVDNGNGVATAGNYGAYKVAIKLTYKINLYNQATTRAEVTEIVDYIKQDFKLAEIRDSSGNKITSAPSKYKGNTSNIAGYNKIYIPVNKTLEPGETQTIYIDIIMEFENTSPNRTFVDALDNGGYKIINIAEINGYKTEEGYLDIDSIPGNIEGENPKEDDESKSPALIFKDPGSLIRTIEGTVFEDVTREELIEGAIREGNGRYDEGTDKQIAGVKVDLIENIGSEEQGIRATTYTNESGNYKFEYVVAGNYKIRYTYGADDKTALIKTNGGQNDISYNGESFEATKTSENLGKTAYWYEEEERKSDAIEDEFRRSDVNTFYQTLRNKKAEILASWKDKVVNRELVNILEQESYMQARTPDFIIEVENHSKYPENRVIIVEQNQTQEYNIKNIDFGIVERARARLSIQKSVSYIEVISGAGEVITSGTYEDWKTGNMKHVKWVKSEINKDGFVSMEIDTELLAGARLRITYDITVKDESEQGNNIRNIEVVDYITNNLNYDESIINNEGKENKTYGWELITTEDLIKGDPYNNYINKTSVQAQENRVNKININEYQTIIKATFMPGETKRITLEKNLTSDEESDFSYDNKVEIISSQNEKGRGDYESIYGNLDPRSYTSKQGDLNWDYKQGTTQTEDHVTEIINENSGFNAIRKVEKDTAQAEKTVITAPTGLLQKRGHVPD